MYAFSNKLVTQKILVECQLCVSPVVGTANIVCHLEATFFHLSFNLTVCKAQIMPIIWIRKPSSQSTTDLNRADFTVSLQSFCTLVPFCFHTPFPPRKLRIKLEALLGSWGMCCPLTNQNHLGTAQRMFL